MTTDDYAPGMALWIGGKWYTIMSITDKGVTKAVEDDKAANADAPDKYPTAAVAAGQCAIGLPRQMRSGFAAEISSTDGAAIRTENQLSSGFNFNPINTPPEFTYQAYDAYADLPSV